MKEIDRFKKRINKCPRECCRRNALAAVAGFLYLKNKLENRGMKKLAEEAEEAAIYFAENFE